MATTTSTMTAGENKPWTLTKTLATQTFNATLTTNGKYLDRDINIDISTKDGVNKIVVPKATDIKTIKPVIADAGDTAALKVTPVTEKPSEGTYIALKTGADSATVTVTAQIVEDGFLKTTDTKQENVVVNVSASDVAYIPLAGTSASADADYGVLANYFTKQDTAEGADVTIKPNYTVANAGYIGEADHVATNPSYWAVKDGRVTGWSKDQTDAPGTVKQITGVTAIESGGALHIAEGWYEESYITLDEIIPDTLDIDAVDGSMLYGHQAFNEKGETLTGSILTYDSKQGAGSTHSTDKGNFYVAGTAGASAFGVIPAHSYVDEQLSIKAGALGAVTLSGSVKPSIAAVTTASTTEAKNITTTASEEAPASAYYVAVQSNAGKADASYDFNVTAGWITEGQRKDTKKEAITLNQSNVTYAPVAAGTVTVAGGALTADSSSNTITTSGMDDGLSAQITDYKIDASAAFKASRAAASLTATDGYIEKAKVDNAAALAAASISENKDAATVYLKKAVITSTGTESTNPSVKTGFDGGAIATADVQGEGYSFPIKITTSATKGSVATRYTATAGYSPAVTDVASGAVEVIADVQSPTITKYVKKGTVSASTSISSQKETYLTVTANAEAADVSITAPVTVTEGYVQEGDAPAGVAAHYTIKKTQLAGSDAAKITLSKKSGATTFSSADGVALHTATETGKTYKKITAATTISVNASSSGAASVAGKSAGWIAGDATAAVTGSGNDSVTNDQDVFIEVYTGEFTFEA